MNTTGKDGFCVKRLADGDLIAPTPVNMSVAYNVIYIKSGKRKYFINNALFNAEEGDVILIGEGDICYDRSDTIKNSDSLAYAMIMTPQFLENLNSALSMNDIIDLFNANKLSVPRGRRQRLETVIDMLYEESFNERNPYSGMLVRVYVSELLIYLARCNIMDFTPTYSLQEERIEEVCSHICSHYNEQLTLGDMAQLAYMSPTYFSKKFKRVTGFGFNEYLNNIRIKMAISMLKHTKYSITEIAVYCGYQDSNYFGDVFRRIVGMSPSKYRKNHSL